MPLDETKMKMVIQMCMSWNIILLKLENEKAKLIRCVHKNEKETFWNEMYFHTSWMLLAAWNILNVDPKIASNTLDKCKNICSSE